MAENEKPRCTGNCMACQPVQRQYCAAQLAYNGMKMLEQITQAVTALADKVAALQDNEALLIDPNVTEETAQNGDGADKEPQDSQTIKNKRK